MGIVEELLFDQPKQARGIEGTLTNSPDDYLAFHAMQLAQFDGAKFVALGDLIRLDTGKKA